MGAGQAQSRDQSPGTSLPLSLGSLLRGPELWPNQEWLKILDQGLRLRLENRFQRPLQGAGGGVYTAGHHPAAKVSSLGGSGAGSAKTPERSGPSAMLFPEQDLACSFTETGSWDPPQRLPSEQQICVPFAPEHQGGEEASL